MELKEYHKWLVNFYQKRNWYDYDSFIRCTFLTEELGELAQSIRKYEIGRDRPDEIEKSARENLEDIKEELGDVIDNILILADKYRLPIEDIITSHKNKLETRFKK